MHPKTSAKISFELNFREILLFYKPNMLVLVVLALFAALIGVSLKLACGVIRAGVKRADKVNDLLNTRL